MLTRSVADASAPNSAYFHELRRVRVRANATAAWLEVFLPGTEPLPLAPDLSERYNPDPRWPTQILLVGDPTPHATVRFRYLRRAGQPADCQRWIEQPAAVLAPLWK